MHRHAVQAGASRKEVRLLVFGRTRLPARYREIYAYTLRPACSEGYSSKLPRARARARSSRARGASPRARCITLLARGIVSRAGERKKRRRKTRRHCRYPFPIPTSSHDFCTRDSNCCFLATDFLENRKYRLINVIAI